MNSYSMFACMGAICARSGFVHVDNVITKRCSKQSHGCFCQGWKATNTTGTFRNLPEPASGTYTSTHRNSPEPSGTASRNLHQHTPGLSGTCSCNPHRRTPELLWAEDPISLRCWGKTTNTATKAFSLRFQRV